MEQKPLTLVVDDDVTLRALTREVLEQAGLRVEEAATGREAIDAFQRERPQIILLDVMMPEMDGFAVCLAIRDLPHGATVPIMVMTGLEDHESIARAYDAGATDFVTKPWNALILSQRVRYMLRASQAGDSLRESERSLAEAQRIAHLGNWRWDLATNRFTASDEVFRILGVNPELFPGTLDAYLDRVHPEDREATRQLLHQTIAQTRPYAHDHRIHHPVHGDRIVREQAEVVHATGEAARQVIGTVQDITDRREAEAQIHYLGYYDQLTQLPNRRLFHDRVSQALALANRHAETGALLLMNLDCFQRINDTLGPTIGDYILKEVAQRLLRCIRKTDSMARQRDTATISRFGGDEFTILLTQLASPHDPAKAIQRIRKALNEPFVIQERTIVLTASIGIVLLGSDGQDVDTLLRNANAAMHAAKGQGRNTYQFYSRSMNVALAERLSLESDMRKALKRNEFVLHYQPQIDVRRWDVIGVEALIRWRHPERGIVLPSSFIPVAEELGMIGEISDWILRTACRQQRAWAVKGLDLSIAVNLSGVQFQQASLVNTIAGIIDETGADPHKLELELTESTAMHQAEHAVEIFHQLKVMGFQLSIDDFGTGYSSLAYLKRFPIDTIKIDQAFVKDLTSESEQAAIAIAIIAMAHGLKLRVIAEGVETKEQLDVLRAHDCDFIQGYFFSQPIPHDLLEQLIESHRSKQRTSGPSLDSLPLAG